MQALKPMPQVKEAVENAKLTEEQRELARQIVGRGGKLRTSKPKDGVAAYVWRLVAFNISPNPQHQCMPCTADFGIPNDRVEHYPQTHSFQRRAAFIREELDPIINAIVDEVPKEQWYGVKRWARVMS